MNSEDRKKFWFFGSKLNTALLAILIILMVVAIHIMLRNEALYLPSLANGNMPAQAPAVPAPEVSGPNKADLAAFSIAPGGAVHGVTTFTGTLPGSYFFEGNVVVHVLNAQQEHVLSGHGTAVGDWMTAGPVNFSSTVDFTSVPKGPAWIELHNDNASGDESKEKTIDIPVVVE